MAGLACCGNSKRALVLNEHIKMSTRYRLRIQISSKWSKKLINEVLCEKFEGIFNPIGLKNIKISLIHAKSI